MKHYVEYTYSLYKKTPEEPINPPLGYKKKDGNVFEDSRGVKYTKKGNTIQKVKE